MKNKILTLIFCAMSVNNLCAENYAILISAGKKDGHLDDTRNNSEYWYDLFLAYEDLILHKGYTHENVIVFYGDGYDAYTSYPRYKKKLHGWTNDIVDFKNSYYTMNQEFANLGNIITDDDNVLIRWVIGHGTFDGTDPDSYEVLIKNRMHYIAKVDIVNMVNQISNYNKRKIIWMTCHSACMGEGDVNLKNDKTVLITSCDVDEVTFNFYLTNETVHVEFNYLATGALCGYDPLGAIIDGDFNNDTYVNLWEVWNYVWEDTIIKHSISNPQLFDTGGFAEYMYLDDSEMEIENSNINFNGRYWSDNFTISNTTLQNGSSVEIIIDDSFTTSGSFEVELGSEFTVK